MSIKKYFVFLFLVFTTSIFFGQADENTIIDTVQSIVYDTVIVESAPVIVYKELDVTEYRRADSKLYFQPSLLIFGNDNSYTPCPGYEGFLNKYSEAIGNKLQYGYGFKLGYHFSHLRFGLEAIQIYNREEFEFVKSDLSKVSNTNKFNYIDVSFLVGYTLDLSRRLKITPNIGFGLNNLISYKGQTIDSQNETDVVSLSKESDYYVSNTTFYSDLQIEYLLTTRRYVFIAPFYNRNVINSITDIPMHYNEQKIYFGIKMGLGFGL